MRKITDSKSGHILKIIKIALMTINQNGWRIHIQCCNVNLYYFNLHHAKESYMFSNSTC